MKNEVEAWISKETFGGTRLSLNMIHGFAERVSSATAPTVH